MLPQMDFGGPIQALLVLALDSCHSHLVPEGFFREVFEKLSAGFHKGA